MLETAMHKHISNQLGRIKIRCHKKRVVPAGRLG